MFKALPPGNLSHSHLQSVSRWQTEQFLLAFHVSEYTGGLYLDSAFLYCFSTHMSTHFMGFYHCSSLQSPLGKWRVIQPKQANLFLLSWMRMVTSQTECCPFTLELTSARQTALCQSAASCLQGIVQVTVESSISLCSSRVSPRETGSLPPL